MAYSPAPTPTVVVVPQQTLAPTPMRMRCPHCGADIMTHTQKQIGLCTYVMVGVCCFSSVYPASGFPSWWTRGRTPPTPAPTAT
uniref:LITAF domain-containing protein n=1 Tax=Amblyomma americanum TaxID=6943 RepID=A0A0C9QYH0_AMBAM